MAVPPSQTRICNATLAFIGESARITSISEGTPLSRLFEQTWDEAIDEVLAAHPWNCAVKRDDLAVSGDFEPEGSQYTQAFEKPTDCLRWLPWRTDHPDFFEGEEEGDYILSNAEAPIYFRYIWRNDNIAKWTPGMREALAAKLAYKLAKPISGQSGMIDRMERKWEACLKTAKREDGLATGDRARGVEYRSDWTAARNRSYTRHG